MASLTTPSRSRRSRKSASASPALRNRKSRDNVQSAAGVLSPRAQKNKPSTPQTSGPPTAPRTVTPTSNYRSAAPSWEDFDEGVYGAAHKARRNRHVQDQRSHSSVVSNTSFEEEMPMDEMMEAKPIRSVASTASDTPSASASIRSYEATNVVAPAPDTGVGRIVTALQADNKVRPNNLTLEECLLWDTIQVSLAKERQGDPSQPATPSGPATQRMNKLEEQLREAKALVATKETEHANEVRAIQRVLAEMTSEREEETQVLNDTVSALSAKVQTLENEKSKAWAQSSPPPPPSAKSVESTPNDAASKEYEAEIVKLKRTIKELEVSKTHSKREADKKARRVMVLERDFKVTKVQLRKAEEAIKERPSSEESTKLTQELESQKQEMEELKQQNQKLQTDLETAKKDRNSKRKPHGSMTPPRPELNDSESVSSAISAEEVEGLQKNLSETASSLENAKKIIASLENANGSMAVDLRNKLKAKDEELVTVQSESSDRKRRLDSLATELRDLQKKQDDVERLEYQNKTQIVRHQALMGLLEKSITGLQSASVVHEVSTATGEPDKANVDQIAEILSDAMIGIRTSLDVTQQYMDEFDDASTVAFTEVDVSSEVGRQIDAIIKNDREALAQTVKDELDNKKIAVRRLEDALQKQSEEMKRLRGELDQRSEGDNSQLMAEIQSLREQCSTNMDVLAKKERELSVLRSSLKVDENDAGYISDDASDGDEEDADGTGTVSSNVLNGYGPADTEALATILAAGGGVPPAASETQLKSELLKSIGEKEKANKELQAERESLANAKMIISSLEKANKDMMEDLRARLQDSNTAIATLLDKSMEHEKNSNTWREELEKLNQEKKNLEAQHENELKKLKDEAKVYSLRIASKDRELNDLRKGVESKTSSEEKKEEMVQEQEGAC